VVLDAARMSETNASQPTEVERCPHE